MKDNKEINALKNIKILESNLQHRIKVLEKLEFLPDPEMPEDVMLTNTTILKVLERSLSDSAIALQTTEELQNAQKVEVQAALQELQSSLSADVEELKKMIIPPDPEAPPSAGIMPNIQPLIEKLSKPIEVLAAVNPLENIETTAQALNSGAIIPFEHRIAGLWTDVRLSNNAVFHICGRPDELNMDFIYKCPKSNFHDSEDMDDMDDVPTDKLIQITNRSLIDALVKLITRYYFPTLQFCGSQNYMNSGDYQQFVKTGEQAVYRKTIDYIREKYQHDEHNYTYIDDFYSPELQSFYTEHVIPRLQMLKCSNAPTDSESEGTHYYRRYIEAMGGQPEKDSSAKTSPSRGRSEPEQTEFVQRIGADAFDCSQMDEQSLNLHLSSNDDSMATYPNEV